MFPFWCSFESPFFFQMMSFFVMGTAWFFALISGQRAGF